MAAHNNMGESKNNYTECKKADKNVYILFDSTYIKFSTIQTNS